VSALTWAPPIPNFQPVATSGAVRLPIYRLPISAAGIGGIVVAARPSAGFAIGAFATILLTALAIAAVYALRRQ
jgi:hypothetical protein